MDAEEVRNYFITRILDTLESAPDPAVINTVLPPEAGSTDYIENISRPGELFMLIRYVEKHLNYMLTSWQLLASDISLSKMSEDMDHIRDVNTDELAKMIEEEHPAFETRRITSKNSDRGFRKMVDDLNEVLFDILPQDILSGIVSDLKVIVDLRDAIAHSTTYNSYVVEDDCVPLGPGAVNRHLTKHTRSPNREVMTLRFDDRGYRDALNLIEKCQQNLLYCAKVKPLVDVLSKM